MDRSVKKPDTCQLSKGVSASQIRNFGTRIGSKGRAGRAEVRSGPRAPATTGGAAAPGAPVDPRGPRPPRPPSPRASPFGPHGGCRATFARGSGRRGVSAPAGALNVKVKKFKEARVNGGSNSDSLAGVIVTRSGRLLVATAGEGGACAPPELRSGPPSRRGNRPPGGFLLVTTQRKEEDPGPSGHGAESNEVDYVFGASTGKDPEWKCPGCEMILPSERSLGMHRHHRHPHEVNEERIVARAKKRQLWSAREDSNLAEAANRTWQVGMTKGALYKHLHSILPNRSDEAIKRRLLLMKWDRSSQQTRTPADHSLSPEELTIPQAQIHRAEGSAAPVQLERINVDPPPLEKEDLTRPPGPKAPTQLSAGMKWSREEEALLGVTATSQWKTGMTRKDLISIIRPTLQHRSADAIKKRLAMIRWSPPVSPSPSTLQGPTPPTLPQTTDPSTPTAGSSTVTPANPDPYESWKLKMADTILRDLKEPPTQATSLREVTQSLRDNKITTEEGAKAIEDLVAQIFPLVWQRKEPRPMKEHPRERPKELRRRQYASIQRLFNLNRKDAATAVLNGSWRETGHGPPREPPGLADFWASVMGKKGPPAKVCANSTEEQYWALLNPIEVEELQGSLKSLTKSAVGMDKVIANNLLAWHLPSLAGLMDLILLTENLPAPLATARITMIPKVQSPGDCSDYRPIAVTPILTRALHKILARRMRDQLAFSATQFAFLQRDGCLEATTILHAILRNCHDNLRPLAVAFLDLSKAFDTVTHEALSEAAEQAGLPLPLLRYIGNVLHKSESVINSRSFRSGRGGRQGDPLSPLLFILAMEKPISAAIRGIGTTLESHHLHSIIYADDMILMADSAPELQAKLDGLTSALEAMGMSLNVRKSAAMTVEKDGKRKAMLIVPTNYHSGAGQITPLGVADSQKYLGLEFNWKGRVTPRRTDDLGRMLEEVKAAPL
ncbi:R2DM Retrovirus-related Pol polyprotein from type II retrotransposable element [Triplophysa tibetana]|uniref:R2DM Retrovirus-related Pol polyprotein from type II retrotransposable element n=1 Tax=Triplophysa tibetana TaxID=1572043 RepID=A0A5A9N0R0_9TELE|nr:R2DM Retrovirus-related Pol polyprotein from type II retrotransposable element [Triplophysa tibetana]